MEWSTNTGWVARFVQKLGVTVCCLSDNRNSTFSTPWKQVCNVSSSIISMSYNVWFIHFTRKNVAHVCLLAGHRFDPNTPIEETMQALHDVVKAGWVRYIGMSSCYAYQCTLPAVNHASIALIRTPQPSPCYAEWVKYQIFNNVFFWTSIPDYAIANKLTPFISMQNHYNLAYREEEREMFPTLKVSQTQCNLLWNLTR